MSHVAGDSAHHPFFPFDKQHHLGHTCAEITPLAGRERDDPTHRTLLREFNVGIIVMVNLDCQPDRVGRHPRDL